MEREDLKNNLIAYLYDEMSTEERLRFEREMEADPKLKNEFLELKFVRKGLSNLEDKEVMEPFFLWGRNGVNGWANPFKRRTMILFKPFVAVAASLAILLLVGYLTNFSVMYQEKGLFIGFNNQKPTESVDALSADQITNLIKNEIARNNSILLSNLNNTESKLGARLTSLENRQKYPPVYRQASKNVTENDLQQYYQQVQNANATLMDDYFRNATVQQQEYFQTVMNQFTEYLQDQREQDLRLIRRSLVSLKEDQDQKQLETQQILAALLNNVNNSNN